MGLWGLSYKGLSEGYTPHLEGGIFPPTSQPTKAYPYEQVILPPPIGVDRHQVLIVLYSVGSNLL